MAKWAGEGDRAVPVGLRKAVSGGRVLGRSVGGLCRGVLKGNY